MSARAQVKKEAQGFTLIEVLIALFIFALIAGVAYASLANVSAAHTKLERADLELGLLQRALNTLELDLRFAVPRAARGAYQPQEPALRGDATSLFFGTTRVQSSLQGPRLEAVRVRHRFLSERWFRAQFTALDLAPNTQEAERLLMKTLSSVSIQYIDHTLRPQPQWPPADASGDQKLLDTLPRAIELRFNVENYGPVRRLILVADAPPPPALRDEP
jgi:general secretion pathway protein J